MPTLEETGAKLETKSEGDILLEVSKLLGNIRVNFEARFIFKSRAGDFLKKLRKKDGVFDYDLFLPLNFNNKDLFEAIFLLNEKLRLNLDTERFTSLFMLRLEKKLSTGIQDSIKVSQAVSNFMTEVSSNISKIIDANHLTKEAFEKYKLGILESKQHSLRQELSSEGINLENAGLDFLDDFFKQEFDFILFKNGINMIRYGLSIIQKQENNTKTKKSFSGKKIDRKSKPNIDKVSSAKKEELLREKIGIEKLKKVLLKARFEKNQKEIDRLELEAINKITFVINKFFKFKNQQEDRSYNPNSLILLKHGNCIGFSLIGHTFLDELGIKHRVLDMSFGNQTGHLAIIASVGGINYYFDPSLYESTYQGELLSGNMIGAYSFFNCKGEKRLIRVCNTQKTILSHIYNTRGSELMNNRKYGEALKILNRSIKLDNNNYLAFYNKGILLGKLGLYDQAIVIFDKVLSINPRFLLANFFKGKMLLDTGKNQEAFYTYSQAFYKAIELNYCEFYEQILDGISKLDLKDICLEQIINLFEYVIEYINKKNNFANLKKKIKEIFEKLKSLETPENIDKIDKILAI